jgi:hypothetical protein
MTQAGMIKPLFFTIKKRKREKKNPNGTPCTFLKAKGRDQSYQPEEVDLEFKLSV